MAGDGGWSQLHEAVASWLPSADLQPHGNDALLLQVDVMQLACTQAHSRVLAALLADPEQVRQAALSVLDQAGALTSQRLWLRPRKLMASAELSLLGALPLLRRAPGLLLSCYGLCTAVTAPYKVPASRTFQCASCSKTCTLHSTQPPPPCCGGALLEVEAARVMVPAQVVLLAGTAQRRPGCTAPRVHHATLALHLVDDLCGRVSVGDRVLATGCGRHYGGGAAMGGSKAGTAPVTLGLKMEALNVEVLPPVELCPAWELGAGAQRRLEAMACGTLQALLRVVDAALPLAAFPLLKLAVLLSAAAAGTAAAALHQEREADPEPQALLRCRVATSRNQVHVMLTSAGPEPHVQRFLAAAASALCDHSVTAADPSRLLPALEAKWTEPSLGVAAPLARGGQLGEAASGVLLLSSDALDAKRAATLGHLLAAGEAALRPGCPELCLQLGATLWTTVHEQDLSKCGRCERHRSRGLPLTERVIARFSQPFFAQHDLLVAAGPATEEEAAALADGVLLGRAAAPGCMPGSQPGQRGASLAALQRHVRGARAAAQPVLSPEAEDLLAAYFKHLRTFAEAQQGVVASLARVACASARLRHSAVVRLVPGAALAVAFVEEKLLAAEVGPVFWPRWRAELLRGADLDECLCGLAEDCCAGLGCAGGAWQTAAEE